MKFKRYERVPYEDTSRKRAAVKASQRREREAAPLFAAEIAAQQPSVDTVTVAKQRAFEEWQQERRDNQARGWRKARLRLAAFPEDQRRKIRALWLDAPYPADPVFLMSMLSDLERGRYAVDSPPWRFTPEEIAAGRARLEEFFAKQRLTQTVISAAENCQNSVSKTS